MQPRSTRSTTPKMNGEPQHEARGNPMKQIILTQGKVAIVDDWNFEWLNQFKWFAHKAEHGGWYAVRNITLSDGHRTLQKMHRAIMGDPEGMEIDHKNR